MANFDKLDKIYSKVCANRLTLNDPKFLTEHPSFMFRPAGTVMFSICSVNSGSSTIAENRHEKYLNKHFQEFKSRKS